MLMKTTLAKIKERTPCEKGWEKLLKTLGTNYPRDKEISIMQILDSNGIADALWALRACDLTEEDSKKLRLFACDCAERALNRERAAGRRPMPESWGAVEIARKYANGEATEDQLKEAYVDAYTYAEAVATFSATYVTNAFYAAFSAAAFSAAYSAAEAVSAYDAAEAATDALYAAYATQAFSATYALSVAERTCQSDKFKEYFG